MYRHQKPQIYQQQFPQLYQIQQAKIFHSVGNLVFAAACIDSPSLADYS